MTEREQDFESFRAAAMALSAETGGECHVYHDEPGHWSAIIERAPGRTAPQTVHENGYTEELRYSLTMAKSFGFDSVAVMLDVFSESYTCDTRITDIVTQGADALDSLYERARVQPGV